MNNFTKGFLAITGAVLFWSLNESVGSLVFKEGASPLTLLTMRFGIASIFVGLTLLLIRKLEIIKEWKILFWGTIIMTAHLIGFWQGIKEMNNIAMAVGIFYLFPIWTAILSAVLWKEKFGRRGLLSLGIGVSGALLTLKVIPYFGAVNLSGVLWMLVAGVGWSGYIMVNKKIADKYNPLTILFYNFLGATIIFCLLQNPIITIGELTTGIVLKTAFMALTSSYMAFMLYTYALKKINPTKASIMNLSKMFFSVLAAYLILSQSVNLLQIGGLGLIFTSIYLLKNG